MDPRQLRDQVESMAVKCSECEDCHLDGDVPDFCEEHKDEFSELRELVENGVVSP